jgi:DUF438 domain-containing protein
LTPSASSARRPRRGAAKTVDNPQTIRQYFLSIRMGDAFGPVELKRNNMELNPKTKIDNLLKAYPFLTDFLAGLRPEFGKLKNPILRKTVGKIASLKQVSALGSIDLNVLLDAIAAEITRKTGQKAVVSRTDDKGTAPLSDKAARHEALKDIIRDLHAGVDMAKLKKRFADLIQDVDPSEIAAMEQKLIEEGMPQEEVKRLCDVHVQVFQEALAQKDTPVAPKGHPVHTFVQENRALEAFLREMEAAGSPRALREALEKVSQVNLHYLRKENQLFPLLEKHEVSGPSQVMWAVHDDIRKALKDLKAALERPGVTTAEVKPGAGSVVKTIRDMIFKEERILFPMCLETLSKEEWIKVRHGEEEIGYAWVQPAAPWPEAGNGPVRTDGAGEVALDTGKLSAGEINLVINHLPVEISFIGADDSVKFYSDSRGERVFPRSPGVIGRKVQQCHPPKSVSTVNKILEAFKSGARDHADFWIDLRGRMLYIRYFVVRDKSGKYCGTLEVTQDVTGIRKLSGEQRLLDWEI